MSALTPIIRPIGDAVETGIKNVFELFRGTWGKDIPPLETAIDNTLSATDSSMLAHIYATGKSTSGLGEPSDPTPQVWKLDVEASNPAIFDDNTVSIDQLAARFEFNPIEVEALTDRYGTGAGTWAEIGDDDDLMQMLRKRNVDLLVHRQGVPENEVVDTVYRILDPSSVKKTQRISPYLVDHLNFYSPARRVVELSDQERGDKGYWMKVLTTGTDTDKPKLGIRPMADAQEMRLDAFLDSKRTFSREEILNFIDTHRVNIDETRYEGVPKSEEDWSDWDLEVEVGEWKTDEVEFQKEQVIDSFWDEFDDDKNEFIDQDAWNKDSIHDYIVREGGWWTNSRTGLAVEEGTQVYRDMIEHHISKWADEIAEQNYANSPYMSATNEQDFFIIGSDDHGWQVKDPDGRTVGDDYFHSLEDAREAAHIHAIEHGFLDSGDSDTVNPHYFPSWTISSVTNEGDNPRNLLLTWQSNDKQVKDSVWQIFQIAREHVSPQTQADMDEVLNDDTIRYKHSDKVGGLVELVLANVRGPKEQQALQPWFDVWYQRHQTFDHSHYDQVENYFAHARIENRYVDGVWSMHIDEIQSDWHKRGYDYGYISEGHLDNDEIFNTIEDKFENIYGGKTGVPLSPEGESYLSTSRATVTSGDPTIMGSAEHMKHLYYLGFERRMLYRGGKYSRYHPMVLQAQATLKEVIESALPPPKKGQPDTRYARGVRALKVGYHEGSKVPDAPFKKTWHEVMFKRLITEALTNDKNVARISWTTGMMQGDRYSGQEPIIRISDVKATPEITSRLPGYDIYGAPLPKQPDYKIEMTIDASAHKAGTVERINEPVRQYELYDMLGEELAEKVIRDVKLPDNPYTVPRAQYPTTTYEGVDVVLGTKGHRDLYDNRIPQFVKKFLAQYGVKVKKARIDHQGGHVEETPDGQWQVFGTWEGGERSSLHKTKGQAENVLEQMGNVEVWYIDITPEMREALKDGIPLTMGDSEDDERYA